MHTLYASITKAPIPTTAAMLPGMVAMAMLVEVPDPEDAVAAAPVVVPVPLVVETLAVVAEVDKVGTAVPELLADAAVFEEAAEAAEEAAAEEAAEDTAVPVPPLTLKNGEKLELAPPSASAISIEYWSPSTISAGTVQE
jgi:hypothetical protein